MSAGSAAPAARLDSADALRALATVFVVVIHTTHWPLDTRLYDDVDLLSRFAVPAFMILTGVLLSYRTSAQRLPAGPFLRRRFSRSLLPWLVWAPVYALVGMFVTTDVGRNAGDLGTYFSYGAGHLWFLLLIPQMYLLYLVWPRHHLWAWAVAALLVQTALNVFRLYGTMPTSLVEQLTLWHGFQLLPFWVGYFAVGLAAGRRLATRGGLPSGWRASAVAAVAVAASGALVVGLTFDGARNGMFQRGTGGFLLPQEPLFVVSVAMLVMCAAPPLLRGRPRLARITRLLSDNSLGVYIFHPLVVFAVGRRVQSLLQVGLPLSVAGFVLVTLSGLVVSTLLSVIIGASPLAATIGARRHRRAGPADVSNASHSP